MGNSSFAAEAILRAEDVQGRRNVRLLSSCRETRGRRCGGLTSSRREKRKTPMISAGDGQFPRDYSGGASTSPDRRRRSAAAGGADAPNGGLGKLSLGGAARGRQQQANYWSFKSRTPRPSPTRTGRVPGERPDVTADFHAPGGFSRADRLRRSLPLARSSANPAKLHTPGVLFLQLGEETRRVHLTHELCSLDTLRALIVHMFPQRLSMATLRSPGTALLIKDESRNVFYELEDPRDVRDRCVVKIYCKEPAVYGTYPGRRDWRPLANGDLRREMVYAPQDSPPSQRPCPPAAASPPQGSPSRTRFLFGGGGVRPSSYAGAAARRRTASPAFGASSGAILERRDVKPDEEAGGARGVMLLRADERRGGGVYADPYSLGLDACAGLAGTPRSPLPSRGDPYGSLYRRGTGGAAVCSMMEGGGLYRAGGALYDDAHAASVLAVGLHVPPPSSPQNIPDARDAYGGTLPSRGSPSRGERRRDPLVSSAGGDGRRSRGLTSEQLCLMAAAVAGGDGIGGDETETRERMEVMEKQIASLTGLLQRVLSRAAEDHSPEKTESASDGSGTEPGRAKKRRAATPSAPLALMPPPPPNVSHVQMQRHLLGLQQSTNALRTQLSQLRHVQLSNQDSVMALLRQTEAELSVLTLDAARTHEDPLQRQRLLVEEERRKYLTQEEALAHKLQFRPGALGGGSSGVVRRAAENGGEPAGPAAEDARAENAGGDAGPPEKPVPGPAEQDACGVARGGGGGQVPEGGASAAGRAAATLRQHPRLAQLAPQSGQRQGARGPVRPVADELSPRPDGEDASRELSESRRAREKPQRPGARVRRRHAGGGARLGGEARQLDAVQRAGHQPPAGGHAGPATEGAPGPGLGRQDPRQTRRAPQAPGGARGGQSAAGGAEAE
ncbi:SRC kinase signaling inhibitor 1-like isoform X5 [Syngnathoides biaculeatus]|uniref:SRC kinase signaling inhibitor 1-like isoform X5 n=1 Tax=Syngnathoides biaculeatus TaxID=300417 RepID=UPI002ADD85DF|nr:SRC kinase signaling inhibitor 1-like isoform X5 [Syngnathoides biaculeatus]